MLKSVLNTTMHNPIYPPLSTDAMTQMSTWFGALPKQKQQELLAKSRVRDLAISETLFRRGDAFDGIYFLVSGGLWISGLDISGAEIGLTVIEPGEWFGEIALFDKQDRTHDVVALKPTQLIHISAAQLALLTEEDPLWWQHFGGLLSQKMRLLFQNLEDRSMPSARIRLARRLMQFGHQHDNADPVKVAIPQEQLGQLLSLSRQKTNQLLKTFEQEGLLTLGYGEFTIINLNKIKAIAFPVD